MIMIDDHHRCVVKIQFYAVACHINVSGKKINNDGKQYRIAEKLFQLFNGHGYDAIPP